MNLQEKRTCLVCGKVIRHNEQISVIANVLLAHADCTRTEGR
jgi:hypothetical protein